MMKYTSDPLLLGVWFKAAPASYENARDHIATVSGAGALVSGACCFLSRYPFQGALAYSSLTG
jgi:hypothetical protein